MRLCTATYVLALVALGDAFWRMPCHSRTGLARIDPIVNPGEVSKHAHAVHGGSGFSMAADYSELRASNCTSCGVQQDTSAYWTPSLHFLYTNGTSVVVPQVGGMLAYYLLFGNNITAFPAGFQMLSGDPFQRNFSWPVPDPPKSSWSGAETSQFALSQKALGFNCLNYDRDPEPSLYRHFMPDKAYIDANCADGLRLELMFPSCWNGKDLDSKNHKDHVAFSSLVMDGTCPQGFETRLPSLFFETIWNTAAFAGQAGQFVLSNGDTTGYGYHGDFMTGWDVPTLQAAIDQCTNPSGEVSDCAVFKLQDDATAAQCTFETPAQLEKDDCAGPREGLCGSNPLQTGPAYATVPVSNTNAPVSPSASVEAAPPTTKAAHSPSLGYTPGTSTITDNGGGQVTVLRVPVIQSPTPFPALTAAPSAGLIAAVPEVGVNVATSTFTSGSVVVDVIYQEIVSTATIVATDIVVANAVERRHERHVQRHRHHRRHGHY